MDKAIRFPPLHSVHFPTIPLTGRGSKLTIDFFEFKGSIICQAPIEHNYSLEEVWATLGELIKIFKNHEVESRDY